MYAVENMYGKEMILTAKLKALPREYIYLEIVKTVCCFFVCASVEFCSSTVNATKKEKETQS